MRFILIWSMRQTWSGMQEFFCLDPAITNHVRLPLPPPGKLGIDFKLHRNRKREARVLLIVIQY
ncbi:MAG: hypothetical protein ACI9ZF_003175 [Bradyrhizobium sp.]|jgi:hypothetical protein